MWVHAPNSDRTLARRAAEFTQSRDHGLACIEALVREWSVRMTISEDTIRTYLTSNIFYCLDGECLNGLQTFYTYAAKYDILPHYSVSKSISF